MYTNQVVCWNKAGCPENKEELVRNRWFWKYQKEKKGGTNLLGFTSSRRPLSSPMIYFSHCKMDTHGLLFIFVDGPLFVSTRSSAPSSLYVHHYYQYANGDVYMGARSYNKLSSSSKWIHRKKKGHFLFSLTKKCVCVCVYHQMIMDRWKIEEEVSIEIGQQFWKWRIVW